VDVSHIQPVSDRVYLAEAYPLFRAYEPENQDDWAWVKIRRATEADNMRRQPYLDTSVLRYLSRDNANVIAESVQGGDVRARIIDEVYWTLEDAGNLDRDGEPLFSKLPVRGMDKAAFIDVWNSLPVDVTAAIYAASLTVNALWMDG